MTWKAWWYYWKFLEGQAIFALEPMMTPIHLERRAADPEHDRISCWCCCMDCDGLWPNKPYV